MVNSTQTGGETRASTEQAPRSRFGAGAQRESGGDRPGGDRPGRGGGRGGFGGGRGRGRKEPIFRNDEVVDYKDVQRLRRCLDERGKISNRRKTNCSAGQQRALTVAIKRARHMALLPFVSDGRR